MGDGIRAQRRAATADRILRAAQDEFGERGLEGGTIRGIARRAHVDPSLVLQHYGSKRALFAEALKLVDTPSPGSLAEHVERVLHERLGNLPPETRALMRSMLTAPEAASAMRSYLEDRIASLAAILPGEDAALRATVISASILGLTIGRHFLELPELLDIDDSRISAVIEPWLTALAADPPE